MKLKEVTVSFGGTINLGNYENFKVDLSVTWAADEDTAEVKRTTSQLFDVVRSLVRDEVAKLASHTSRNWLRHTDLKTEPAPEETD